MPAAHAYILTSPSCLGWRMTMGAAAAGLVLEGRKERKAKNTGLRRLQYFDQNRAGELEGGWKPRDGADFRERKVSIGGFRKRRR